VDDRTIRYKGRIFLKLDSFARRLLRRSIRSQSKHHPREGRTPRAIRSDGTHPR